ncbi:restriction endonuclease subunit S [Enterococcus faecium]|uniref:restriction endonuclease subunit S n=1 Tax=Enterococcus faecium TaxID=1352 RepID=UPI000CF2EA67|nr:restriction endonuclease subunit S [Enterococcus faecium]PQF72123.1 restriction endonuclease subunit S [Enterococcus faecium]
MSNNTQPEIRFPGFTEDWEERKLRDITERVRGNDGRMDLPTLTISASSGWLDQRDRFSGNIAGKEQKNYTLLKKGQLSYNHGNSKLAKYGVVCELTTYDEALVPRVYHSFDTNELASSNFIEYMFATKRPDRELAKLVSSGARMDGLLNINFDEFMGINVSVPSVEEQQKIGTFFKQIDDTIALHQSKLDLLKETKKGFLQKMFPKNGAKVPEIRFPGFTEDWEERKLGDITKISTGKLDANAMVENGKYDFYTSGIKKYRIDVAAFEGPSITIAGNGATVGYMHLADNKFNAYQRTYVLQEFLVDRSFIFSEIGNKLPKKIKQEARTGNIPYIVMDMLTELKLSIPQNNSEQQKIGNFFKQLDDTITLHQRKLDLLKETKKGFLQKMFV